MTNILYTIKEVSPNTFTLTSDASLVSGIESININDELVLQFQIDGGLIGNRIQSLNIEWGDGEVYSAYPRSNYSFVDDIDVLDIVNSGNQYALLNDVRHTYNFSGTTNSRGQLFTAKISVRVEGVGYIESTLNVLLNEQDRSLLEDIIISNVSFIDNKDSILITIKDKNTLKHLIL